jgi:hypothetical protein
MSGSTFWKLNTLLQQRLRRMRIQVFIFPPLPPVLEPVGDLSPGETTFLCILPNFRRWRKPQNNCIFSCAMHYVVGRREKQILRFKIALWSWICVCYLLPLNPLPDSSLKLPQSNYWAVLGIRIRNQIRMFLGLLRPDPDPLVRGMDPDPSLFS